MTKSDQQIIERIKVAIDYTMALIDKMGIERAIEALKSMNDPVNHHSDHRISLIINLICDKMKISFNEIKHNRTWRSKNSRVHALSLICYFLYKYSPMSLRSIAMLVNRASPTVSVYRKEILDLTRSKNSELFKTYLELDEEISAVIEDTKKQESHD